MKTFVRWVVWVPLGAVLVTFLVANREPVSLSLDPFSTSAPAVATPALPLWFWLIFALLGGFFLGVAGMWTSGRAARRQAADDRRELKALKRAQSTALTAAPAPVDPDDGGTIPSPKLL